MAEQPVWLRARAGRVAITIGVLMCLPGALGVALGVILRHVENVNPPLWSPARAINLPIWLGLLFLLCGLGYVAWGTMRLRSIQPR